MDKSQGKGGKEGMSTGKSSHMLKFEGRLENKGVVILFGGAFAVALIVFLVALSIPKERRACALMPGFCAPKKEAPKTGKFDGIGAGPGAAPFSLNQ
jgi:hypothetical protein